MILQAFQKHQTAALRSSGNTSHLRVHADGALALGPLADSPFQHPRVLIASVPHNPRPAKSLSRAVQHHDRRDPGHHEFSLHSATFEASICRCATRDIFLLSREPIAPRAAEQPGV